MTHEGVHRQPSRENKPNPTHEEGPIGQEEMVKFQQAQRVLALVAYGDEHHLVIDPTELLSRKDLVAKQVRSGAGFDWAQSHEHDDPTFAALYRNYWKEHKDEVLALDLNDMKACISLIEKMRRTPARIKRTLH